MNNQAITVVYQWTPKAGQAEALQAIYQQVAEQMQANEPNALKVDCYFDPERNVLVVYDLFKDAEALGLHLSTTAAGHFPQLLQIAEPGPFLFMGEVPGGLKQAAIGMGLNATFAPQKFGFVRGETVPQ
ncbi:MAG: antibiotic biosynthesis monooxygenase [Bacteroidota bacterium]